MLYWLLLAAVTFVVGYFVGANNPHWFKRNTASLEAVANKALAKVQELKQRGLK